MDLPSHMNTHIYSIWNYCFACSGDLLCLSYWGDHILPFLTLILPFFLHPRLRCFLFRFFFYLIFLSVLLSLPINFLFPIVSPSIPVSIYFFPLSSFLFSFPIFLIPPIIHVFLFKPVTICCWTNCSCCFLTTTLEILCCILTYWRWKKKSCFEAKSRESSFSSHLSLRTLINLSPAACHSHCLICTLTNWFFNIF